MPELPDVEGFRRVLAEHGAGRRVREAKAPDSGVLRNTRPAALARALLGRRLQEPERRGKWLFVRTDGPTLLFHFGMSGELRWARRGEERHRHDRLILALDRGELRYRGQRELQGVWLAADGREAESVTGPLGPDALGLRRGEVRRRIERRRGRVKAALMDQELVAGLGNLLADEVLWQARIHPLRSVDELTEGE
jgi:formamidopyrimidine-DNA glycosylase